MGQLRGAVFGLILRQWSVGAAFEGSGQGAGRGVATGFGTRLCWDGGSACVEDAGGCRSRRVQRVACIGEKEIGAQALGRVFGHKGREQEEAGTALTSV